MVWNQSTPRPVRLGSLRLQLLKYQRINRAKVFLAEVILVLARVKTRNCQSVFEFDPAHGTVHRQMVAAVWESRVGPLVSNETAGARPPRVSGASHKVANQIRRQHPIGFGITQLSWTGRLDIATRIPTVPPPIDAAKILVTNLPLRPSCSAGSGVVRCPII